MIALCREQGFTHLAVAHNLDDNAETLLLHLLRGTGLRGITGIREAAPLPGAEGVEVIRPLLGFSRQDIEAYAVRAGVEFRVDATNADTAIPRNRIRHETNPQVLSENRLDWAEITRQIQSLCQRIKRFQRIQRDTPRLLNLLKTELRAKHAFKHPIKEQQKQRTRTYDLER